MITSWNVLIKFCYFYYLFSAIEFGYFYHISSSLNTVSFLQYFRPYPEVRFLTSVLKRCSLNCLLSQPSSYFLTPLLFSLMYLSIDYSFFLLFSFFFALRSITQAAVMKTVIGNASYMIQFICLYVRFVLIRRNT